MPNEMMWRKLTHTSSALELPNGIVISDAMPPNCGFTGMAAVFVPGVRLELLKPAIPATLNTAEQEAVYYVVSGDRAHEAVVALTDDNHCQHGGTL